MSPLVPRPETRPANRSRQLTREEVIEAVAKPLRMLPPDWRIPAWEFWAGWSHILPDQLALSARLRRWHEDGGLTLDDVRSIFASLNTPEAMARFQFAGQLLAELARLVHVCLDRRQKLQAMLAARRESAEFKAAAADLGKMPE